jgi:hypothetical protein
MVVEALVLGDHEGVADDRRDLPERDQGPALEADLGEESPIGGVELGGLPGGVVLEDVDRRTLPTAADERPRPVGHAGGRCGREDEHEE